VVVEEDHKIIQRVPKELEVATVVSGIVIIAYSFINHLTTHSKPCIITFVRFLIGLYKNSMKTKRHLINVAPKTSKTHNRFCNMMDSLHAMEVEQETDTQFFVVSINKRYCFWLNKENDPHWNIIK
jgi:hypothetical protein